MELAGFLSAPINVPLQLHYQAAEKGGGFKRDRLNGAKTGGIESIFAEFRGAAPRFLASCAVSGHTPPHPGAHAPVIFGGGDATAALNASFAKRRRL